MTNLPSPTRTGNKRPLTFYLRDSGLLVVGFSVLALLIPKRRCILNWVYPLVCRSCYGPMLPVLALPVLQEAQGLCNC